MITFYYKTLIELLFYDHLGFKTKFVLLFYLKTRYFSDSRKNNVSSVDLKIMCFPEKK